MLQRLSVKNFTVFAEADFEFSRGLNVVVGTNGTGKSHVLKLGYAVLSSLVQRIQALAPRSAYSEGESRANSPAPNLLDVGDLAGKLVKSFRPSPADFNELIRRNSEQHRAEIQYWLYGGFPGGGLTIKDTTTMERSVPLSPSVEAGLRERIAAPVLIPAKEILTLGWMTQAARQLRLPLDENYLELLIQLSGLPLQNPVPAATAALQQLTAILGGEVEEDNGRFYLVFPKEKRLEMNMVAEGLRKFGTLQKLLANGSLTPQATLFWDEPEANLNPALLRKLAAVLAGLARQGFQIVLATHSLFLLNELHILAQTQPLPVRYFGLYQAETGETRVEQTDDLETLTHLVALDEEIAQTTRFQRVLDNEDANA